MIEKLVLFFLTFLMLTQCSAYSDTAGDNKVCDVANSISDNRLQDNEFEFNFNENNYNELNLIDVRRNGLKVSKEKYTLTLKNTQGIGYTFTLLNESRNDTGNYTFNFDKGCRSMEIEYIHVFPPKVTEFSANPFTMCMVGKSIQLKCDVIGFPIPNVMLKIDGRDTPVKNYQNYIDSVTTTYKYNVSSKDLFKKVECVAINEYEEEDAAQGQVVTIEVDNGFDITDASLNSIINNDTTFNEYDSVSLTCVASKYLFKGISWAGPKGLTDIVLNQSNIIKNDSLLSYKSTLYYSEISKRQEGLYTCQGFYKEKEKKPEALSRNIKVRAHHDPVIFNATDSSELIKAKDQKLSLFCDAEAVPKPNVQWTMNGKILKNDRKHTITNNEINKTAVHSSLEFKVYEFGIYKCLVTVKHLKKNESHEFDIKNIKTGVSPVIKGTLSAAVVSLIILIVYLLWKIRKEKAFRKELAAAGLLNFKDGNLELLNPELCLTEQAELLPYEEKFEFAPENIKWGRQLGAGAFGVVFKAEARGLLNAEETTTVAIKTVKKTADNIFIKALATELKIMCHMGKHVNVVNLLGACTKNVAKRELNVILEYCKYGNLHTYIQKHRDVFVNQFEDNPVNVSYYGRGLVNRAYLSSTTPSGRQSTYFCANQSQATDSTFMNSDNYTNAQRKASETVESPEWRSNYDDGDYVYDGRPLRPLKSEDLISWGFQIARGMQYLSSRKILHSDLAARNVLLSDDNIVKICDFGLARSIYGNDEYHKQENTPLPVKWLAIECMTDKIFSTQSDVWSFGVVLWEMFSLCRTPYPNISPKDLLNYLFDGHRLPKPEYSNDKLYEVMKKCWHLKPIERPSFAELQEIIGSYMDQHIREKITEQDAKYVAIVDEDKEKKDYLAMVLTPDYNKMVPSATTPHYANGNKFFPSTPPVTSTDADGYLSPTDVFSPRTNGNKFNFDIRNPSTIASTVRSDPNGVATPLLALNNIQARPSSGSECNTHRISDKNTCLMIEEETDDDVFPDVKMPTLDTSALSNPEYYAFDSIKKRNSQHTYLNV